MNGKGEPNTHVGWTPNEIRSALAPGAQSRIAERLGKHRAMVSDVISGRFRSRRIEGEIAKTLRVKRSEIFPVRKEAKAEEAAA